MDLFKIILATFSIAKKRKKMLSRKDIGAIIYILDKLAMNEPRKSFNIMPDGVYSSELNRLIDYLIYTGLIEVENEALVLTKRGLELAERALAELKDTFEASLIETLLAFKLKSVWELSYNLAFPNSHAKLSYETLTLIKSLSKLTESFESHKVFEVFKNEIRGISEEAQ